MKNAWAAECFLQPGRRPRACVVALRLCLSLCVQCRWGEGSLKQGRALSGPWGRAVWSPAPGCPRLPRAVALRACVFSFPGQCDLKGQHVGSGARLSGSQFPLCR